MQWVVLLGGPMWPSHIYSFQLMIMGSNRLFIYLSYYLFVGSVESDLFKRHAVV